MATPKTKQSKTVESRVRLSRDRIIGAAMAVADREGLHSLTMRRLADELGSKPMSVYHHVANKDDLLDAMVDAIFAEIELPGDEPDWKTAMRKRTVSAHEVMQRHGWAPVLVDSRTNPGPATMGHHNWVIGTLRRGGFTIHQTAHAFSLLDSYVYGFTIQEVNLPFESGDDLTELTEGIMSQFPVDQFPYMAEMLADHVLRPGYDHGNEFDFGLDLILEGLQALLGQAD